MPDGRLTRTERPHLVAAAFELRTYRLAGAPLPVNQDAHRPPAGSAASAAPAN
jgi:hypothetical protein